MCPWNDIPPKFLATNQHAASQHVVGNVVETDRGLDDLQSVVLGKPVDHARGGDGFDDLAPHPTSFDQVLDRQSHNAMRVDELAPAVHGTDPVGVAVGGHAQLSMTGGNGASQRPQVPGNGLGMDAAEPGIHLTAHLEHLATGALKDAFDLAAARAEHRIDHQMLRVVGDGLEIDQVAEMGVVVGGRIEALDEAGFLGSVEVH